MSWVAVSVCWSTTHPERVATIGLANPSSDTWLTGSRGDAAEPQEVGDRGAAGGKPCEPDEVASGEGSGGVPSTITRVA